MKKILSLFISLLLILILIPTNVRASLSDAYTIITNPGEDASSEMNINWHMDQGITGGKIIYTKKSDTNWTSATTVTGVCKANTVFDGMSSKSPSNQDITENPNIQRCTANLTDLDSDAEYMYKVGSAAMSDIHYFKTAGADEFSFLWMSDWHAYTPLPGRLNSAMNMINTALQVDPSVDFMFTTGDVAAWGGSYSFWKDMYSREPYKNYMWAGVNGNHDNMDRTSSKNSNKFFLNVNNNPLNGYEGQEGVCYYFKYNNVLFIILNNEVMGTSISSEQVEKAKAWVSEVIENNPSQYIFVAEHYEWFNGVNGAYRNYGINRWEDLFDKYGVDLAMAGNNHIYLRTKPIYNKQVVEDGEGTVYMNAPSADNERGQAMNNDLTYNDDKIAYRFTEGGKTVGAILVTVTETKVTTRLLDRTGKVLDNTDIPARRMVGNLDKDAFENSFVYTSSKLVDGAGVIHCDVKALGNIKKIEYYDPNNNILGTNLFDKKANINYILTNVSSLDYINVKIYYNDDETSLLKLKINNSNYDMITNLRVENDYLLKWDYSGTENFTQAIFVDGNFVGEVNANAKGCALSKLNLGSVVELRDSKDAKFSRLMTKYTLFGDVNEDGKVDLADIVVIQNHVTGINTINNDLLILADINRNGIIDMLDATYLQLYIRNYFISIGQVKYKIEFKDMNGFTITTQEVVHGKNAIAPTSVDEVGYSFIKWDKDFSYITSDLVIYSIYEGN